MRNHSQVSYNSNHVPLPLQPPRKARKSRTWLWLMLGIITGLALAGAGYYTFSIYTSSTQTTTTVSQGNTTGIPVIVNANWTVTLNNVSVSDGSKNTSPSPENIFLVVNVMLQNTSTRILTASSMHMFDIKDAKTGQTYQQVIGFGQSPDGTVASGGFIEGRIAFEVPAGHHTFTLQFAPGADGIVLAEWNLMI